MIEIKLAKEEDIWLSEEKGVYRRGTSNGKKTATMSCPDCGQSASLSEHSIYDGGKVSPSVVCPNDGCNFHEYVKLLLWEP